MPVDLSKFEVVYKGSEITIESTSLSGAVIFKVILPDNSNLFITRATNSDGKKFWTSIPEGNQSMAEEIGILIENYYRTNQ